MKTIIEKLSRLGGTTLVSSAIQELQNENVDYGKVIEIVKGVKVGTLGLKTIKDDVINELISITSSKETKPSKCVDGVGTCEGCDCENPQDTVEELNPEVESENIEPITVDLESDVLFTDINVDSKESNDEELDITTIESITVDGDKENDELVTKDVNKKSKSKAKKKSK